ncbi:unnamed protein product [Moneuplotes crassus]|uniref:Uncharacterized protein n=1 Tax=Euplotes crassus TaxID=5936 RepID=A0AAD1X8I8_EUPCR|nr:unnamed protein product [Moneuplotes crassus]
MKSQLYYQEQPRTVPVEEKIYQVSKLFGNFREAGELRQAYKKLAVIPQCFAKQKNISTHPCHNLKKMCTKINPSLFSKATTIEHIHKNPQNPQKSHLNHSSTRAQNPVAELTSQYSTEQEGRDLLVHRRSMGEKGVSTSTDGMKVDREGGEAMKDTKDCYNLLMNRHRRNFNPPKPSNFKNICAGTNTTKFNELNREETLRSLKRSNKKSYYALLKKEFQKKLKRNGRNLNRKRQRTRDFRNKIITLSSTKESKHLKSRSESVEKLIKNETARIRNQFYNPTLENPNAGQAQLPFINYETGYSEQEPKFRRTQQVFCHTTSNSKLGHNYSIGNPRLREKEIPYKRVSRTNKGSTGISSKGEYLCELSNSNGHEARNNEKEDTSSFLILKNMAASHETTDFEPKRMSQDQTRLTKKATNSSLYSKSPVQGRSCSLLKRNKMKSNGLENPFKLINTMNCSMSPKKKTYLKLLTDSPTLKGVSKKFRRSKNFQLRAEGRNLKDFL